MIKNRVFVLLFSLIAISFAEKEKYNFVLSSLNKTEVVIRTSSVASNNHGPFEVLFGGNGWCAEVWDSTPWIEINFGRSYEIKEISVAGIKGRTQSWYIYRYKLIVPYRQFQILPGPNRKHLEKTHIFQKPFITDKLRIQIPRRDWTPPNQDACMKFEVRGSYVKTTTAKHPIDYCSLNNACDQICVNGLTRALCYCKLGYTLVNGKCEDINECTRETYRCDLLTSLCVNTLGSYKCKCNHDGLKLTPFGRKCVDRNECNENNGGCEQYCTNSYKSYKCSCRDGYVLDSDLHTCNENVI